MTDILKKLTADCDAFVLRYSDNGESTQGLLFVNGAFACHTLEDEHRTDKVKGETCIPAGRYRLALRTEGTFNEKYSKRFPDIHRGMLHVTGVPGFEFILIHAGNTDDDTAGCLLVGNSTGNNRAGEGRLGDSTGAYIAMYQLLRDLVEKNKDVFIKFIDMA